MRATCAVSHTAEGAPCSNQGVVEFHGRLVCRRHATRLEATESEDRGAYLEGVIFHLETWLERARARGEEGSVRDLEAARADAAAELYMTAANFGDRAKRQIQNASVHALLAALDAYDEYTGEHSEAVVALSASVAREMGLFEDEVGVVEQAALLHDIGKIGIPGSLVNKPGPLDAEEWAQMREHPVIGARLVGSVEGLSHLAPVIRAEHERWDGWGYPDGLKGEEIPLPSRIVFACDAYHAMVSDRPYRQAMGANEAMEEIERNSGSQFCPRTARALLTVLGRRETGGQTETPAAIMGVRLVGTGQGADPAGGPGGVPYQGGEGPPSSGGPGARRTAGDSGAMDDDGGIEETHTESEERYRLLVELSPELIAIHVDGRLAYINPAGAELLGVADPKDLAGRPVLDLVHPDYRDMAGERVRRIVEEGARTELAEEKLVRTDGESVDVEISGVPVLYDGKVAVQVVARDITARKRAEEALRHSEERFRSIIEYASDVITILEVDGTIRYESPSIERLLGYAPGELVGESAFDYVHEEDLGRVLDAFLEGIAESGASRRMEYRFRHKDGSWRLFEAIGNNLLHDPRINGVVVTSRDVTRRRKAEEALHKAETRYRTLVEQVPAVVYVDALDDVSSAIYMSPQVEEMLGYAPDEWLEDPELFAKLLHPEDRERVLAEHVRANRVKGPLKTSYRLVARDGRVVGVRDESVVVENGGGEPSFRQGLLLREDRREGTPPR